MPAPDDAAESGHSVPRQRTAEDVRAELRDLRRRPFSADPDLSWAERHELRRVWWGMRQRRVDDLLDELVEALAREAR